MLARLPAIAVSSTRLRQLTFRSWRVMLATSFDGGRKRTMFRYFLHLIVAILVSGSAMAEPEPTGRLLEGRHASIADFDPSVRSDVAVPDDAPLFSGVTEDSRLIAIIDSGVLRLHPWLSPVVVEEHSFVGGSPRDRIGHGTAVALRLLSGIAAAARQMGRPLPAIGARSQVRLLSLKVTDDGTVRLEPVLRAIEFAGSRGVIAVNLSLGFDAPGLPERDRRKLCDLIARWPDISFLAASGNTVGIAVYPASCGLPNITAVQATDSDSGPAPGGAAREGRWRPVSASQRLSGLFAAATGGGRLAEAEAILAEMRRVLGNSLVTSLAEAEMFVHRKDFAGLKAHAASIAPAFSGDVRYRFFEGVAAYQSGDFPDALSAFARVKRELPGFTPARFNLAQALMALGRHAEALEELRALRNVAPNYPNLAEAMARASAGAGRPP